MNDDLEERKRRAQRVGPECQRWRGGEEAVHDVVRVWRKADQEEKLGTLLNGPHDTLDGDRA